MIDDEARANVHIVHIPKTGGTTLSGFLREAASLEGAGRTVTNSHEPLPEGWVRPDDSATVVLLRDPVERAISHYRHIVGAPSHRHHRLVTRNKWSIRDYLEWPNGRSHLLNRMTRQLCGGRDSNADLNGAIRRLREIDFIGLTSEMSELAAMIQFGLGLPPMRECERQNSGVRGVTRHFEVSADDRRWLASIQEEDYELYRVGCDAFLRSSGDFRARRTPPWPSVVEFLAPVPSTTERGKEILRDLVFPRGSRRFRLYASVSRLKNGLG